jgi:predicted nucleic acid-binding protein
LKGSGNDILDTEPLISLLNPSDTYHQWTTKQIQTISPPFITCEPVITEACFLAARHGNSADSILELLDNGFMRIDMSLQQELKTIRALMQKYQDVPMSLADAGLVRLAEYYPDSKLFTLDSDFEIYRIHRNQTIPLIYPNMNI